MARTRSMTKMERDGLLINRIKTQLKKVQWIHLRVIVSMVVVFDPFIGWITLPEWVPEFSIFTIHLYLTLICCYEGFISDTDLTQTDAIFVTVWFCAFFVDDGHSIMCVSLISHMMWGMFSPFIFSNWTLVASVLCFAGLMFFTSVVMWVSTNDTEKVIRTMCTVAITLCVIATTCHHILS